MDKVNSLVALIKYISIFCACMMLGWLIWSVYSPKIYKENEGKELDKPLNGGNLNQPKYGISITNSSFQGFNKENHPYRITADAAVKTQNNQYNLQNVSADMYLPDDVHLKITAKLGSMDENTKILRLNEDLKMQYEDVVFFAETMNLDMINSTSWSDNKVEVLYKNSKIRANKFSTQNQNNTIKFNGNVITEINISDF